MNSSFQFGVGLWMLQCFGDAISSDSAERNHRFLEEAIELVQACGCTASEAHQLVDYVFNRPVGEKGQEVGGVMVTLAALGNAQAIDIEEEAEKELRRVWGNIEDIRAKHASKPKHSPLPEANERDTIAALDRAFGAISAAKKHARKTLGSGAPGTGEFPCPACDRGILHYEVVAPLGRMNGVCSTKGCVSWANQ